MKKHPTCYSDMPTVIQQDDKIPFSLLIVQWLFSYTPYDLLKINKHIFPT